MRRLVAAWLLALLGAVVCAAGRADTYNFYFSKPKDKVNIVKPPPPVATMPEREATPAAEVDDTPLHPLRQRVPRFSAAVYASLLPVIKTKYSRLNFGMGLGVNGAFGYRASKHIGFSIWSGGYAKLNSSNLIALGGVDFEYYFLSRGDFPWEYSPLEVLVSVGASSAFDSAEPDIGPHIGAKLIHNIDRNVSILGGARIGWGYFQTEAGVLFHF